jgi:curli biogenesis system outer membrane secretion channel CsgG
MAIGNILNKKDMGIMKKFVFYVLLFFVITGCAASKERPKMDQTLLGQPLGSYVGPKAKVAVTDFEIKTAGANKDTGASLREIFINALAQSNRFKIVPQDQADLIVNISVIEFDPEASGGKAGFAGGGSSGGSFMGGLLGASLNKANMGLDLRLADKSNSAVISQKIIRAQASVLLKNRGKELPRWLVLKNGLAVYAGTPMDTVIHDCIIEGLRYLAQNVPLDYYKY